MNNMKMHIGTKLLLAVAMTLQEYNDYRGWDMPDDEDGSAEGCLVEYQDGGKPNHPDHAGYISWSPKEVFDNAYQDIEVGMSFGNALEMIKKGRMVARNGWNGTGMFVFLVKGSHFRVNRPPLLGIFPEGTGIDYRPHIDMKTANGDIVPWVASQSDMLCNDWVVVD